ncbi:MAG: C40 family peptidase [Marmoricola sp.]
MGKGSVISVSKRVQRLIALPLLAFAIAAASFTLGPVSSASAASREHKIRQATRVAVQQIGDPYKYGAAGPRAFDCSGLIKYSFDRAGMRSVPRTSSAQARYAKRIKKSRLRRGDLMFFTNRGRVYHAGIFLRRSHGKVVMLSAPSTGKRVRRDRPWTSSWFGATLRR